MLSFAAGPPEGAYATVFCGTDFGHFSPIFAEMCVFIYVVILMTMRSNVCAMELQQLW